MDIHKRLVKTVRGFFVLAKIFSRSYKYETDCLEAGRLEKLRKKCLRDAKVVETETTKSSQGDSKHENNSVLEDSIAADTSRSTYQDSFRWRNEPDLLASSIKDPCVKRREMSL